jgi:hypothetical protein
VVKWLHENRNEGCTTRAMNWASRYGHFEVVKWLHFNRKEGCTEYAINSAAQQNHFQIVKWLYEMGYPASERALIGEIVAWLQKNVFKNS